MMMNLHWSPKSPYVRKEMICAHELELTDRPELIGSVAAMLKPNERLMLDNPLSKIPTLVLGDSFAIFDSVVICECLDALGRGAFFPKQGSDKWQALCWHAWGDGLLDTQILWRSERRASLGQLDDEAQAVEETALSIGHVAIGCALGYLDYRFDAFGWRAQAPRMAESFDATRSRASFRTTEPVDG